MTATPQVLPVTAQPRKPEAWEYQFAQSLGIDAPFARVELFVSDRTPPPRQRLLLIQRPGATATPGPIELTGDALCFERVEGATTTFHVRADTPSGPLDWRFEWPEPVSPQGALQITIGLYQEPSRPTVVGAAER